MATRFNTIFCQALTSFSIKIQISKIVDVVLVSFAKVVFYLDDAFGLLRYSTGSISRLREENLWQKSTIQISCIDFYAFDANSFSI